MGRLDIGVT